MHEKFELTVSAGSGTWRMHLLSAHEAGSFGGTCGGKDDVQNHQAETTWSAISTAPRALSKRVRIV